MTRVLNRLEAANLHPQIRVHAFMNHSSQVVAKPPVDISRSARLKPAHVRLGWLALALLVFATLGGCDRRTRNDVPRLPFDVRPTMGAMRLDCRVVRQAIERENLAAGMQAIARLRDRRINRKKVDAPESFNALEQGLKERIEALYQTMSADDQAGSEVALTAMLEQCSACHTAYRALGPDDVLLR